jgi:protein TonB
MPAPSPEHQEPQQTPPQETNGVPTENVDSAAPANNFADVLATPLGRGMANGFFSTLAEGRTLRDDIRGYYFELLERINDRWWQRAATLKDSARRDGIAEVVISRDGTLYEVRLISDTGSREVDRAIIDVLSGASPFSALPASYEPNLFHAPLKFTAPSNLFKASRGR